MESNNRSSLIGRPDVLLRAEALLALILSCLAYQVLYAGHWGFFALLFFAPDISLVPYLAADNRASAAFYNLVHNYAFPLALFLLAWLEHSPIAGELALIWFAHISFDRLLGYGLKFPGAFRYTHVQSSAADHRGLQ